jgi:hypothetical protein
LLGGSKLYTTGAFYFCVAYRGSNLVGVAQLLKAAHAHQRLPHGGSPGGVGNDDDGSSDKATAAARLTRKALKCNWTQILFLWLTNKKNNTLYT